MATKGSATPATQWLQKHGVAFISHSYEYAARGGAVDAAHKLGIDLYHTVKTLVMENEKQQPLIILMHGDQSVSTKHLARQTGAKHIQACTPDTAQRHSGYLVGGTSPFGLRKPMPIWVQHSILELEQVWINGGKRGLLLQLNPKIIRNPLGAQPVDVQNSSS